MQITGAQAVIKSLLAEGVNLIFGYPGGANMPIYDALYDHRDKIRHILVRHEQGAVHAAEGFARVSGRVGVCLATSGPGATNLVTGIADAMLDSVPLVCITGQVASNFIGTDAFQEADIIGITTPITKWNYQITCSYEIPGVFAKAFHIARSGRPGPVIIDITKDAQFAKLDFHYPKKVFIPSYQPTIYPHARQIAIAADLLNQAKQPLILAGHGVLISHAEEELKELAEKANIPVAVTLHGISSFPAEHRLYVGLLGMHGNYAVNLLANRTDVVLAVGMRFDDRVTGRLQDYLPNSKVIHIDIDPAELNKNVKAYVPIVADAKPALSQLIKKIDTKQKSAWLKEFQKYYALEKQKVIAKQLALTGRKLKMAQVIDLLTKKTNGEAYVVADVGQHQMVTARYYRPRFPNGFISSGGMGTMGFALPAAMGVKLFLPNRQVVAVCGDGSFQMNIQELATIAQEKLAVKVIILNNSYLGMVRQWQELFFDRRYSMTQMNNPDFVKIAEGFGLAAERVNDYQQLEVALGRLLAAKSGYILEVLVETEENVFPMVPPGASVAEVRLE